MMSRPDRRAVTGSGTGGGCRGWRGAWRSWWPGSGAAGLTAALAAASAGARVVLAERAVELGGTTRCPSRVRVLTDARVTDVRLDAHGAVTAVALEHRGQDIAVPVRAVILAVAMTMGYLAGRDAGALDRANRGSAP